MSYANLHFTTNFTNDSHASGSSHLDLLDHAVAAKRVALYILGSDESSEMNREALQRIRGELGLDQPLIVQYGEWIWKALRFDFGNSYWTRQPVIEELGRRYPMTANLAFLSLILGTLIAIPIGVLSAVRQDTMVDYAARIFSIAGLSIPSFWLAILVILGLVHYFNWLPPLDYAPFWVDPWLNFQATGLPCSGDGLSPVCYRSAHDAIEHPGGLARRLCTHGPHQGGAGTRRGAQARTQERLAPCDHHYRD